MYRYSVDNAVTYTSEDFVLFRESPFACWMERLTLENPDHGIPPDVGGIEPQNTMERQDDIVDTLRNEGRDVTLVEWDLAEPKRRTETLEAMRGGVDFIVNGQLALGPLSGSANLLMRTSGYSELGDFLYVPCDTQAKTTLHSAFRLCFLADLLHSLQGQLPPQMLIIRGGSDVVPLQSEDHIYHYRAVKQHFMVAMRNFRKHRMPDPAESSHFGRWSDCAHEVLKQRALSAEQQGVDVLEEDFGMPLLQAASAAGESASPYDLDDISRREPNHDGAALDHPGVSMTQRSVTTPLAVGGQLTSSNPVVLAVDDGAVPAGDSPTLAEQARMVTPDTYLAGLASALPGSTPNLAAANRAAVVAQQAGNPGHNHKSADVALENLEFIGSSQRAPLIGMEAPFAAQEVAAEEASAVSEAPAPALHGHLEPQVMESLADQVKPHPLDSVGFNVSERSVVDMDAAPATSIIDASVHEEVYCLVGSFDDVVENDESDAPNCMRSFSDSLITSDDYED
ncbi:MAG: hypothetical protein DRR04_05960 [Gammaproteobacteria bacterium]|nr:MAG: hypothetical protein DRQ97_08205 [Gammaproteobacteria bacterium]RLA60331.1 MAG: hypothetical protein DRR04_05960 [Gammaproteobacteria bacterium]